MDAKTFADVHATIPASPPSWKELYEAQKKKMEALELVASYARDVVDFWPLMTLRTIRVMIPKMDSLKQALGLAKR
jgi:hypothetical protein